MSEQPYHPSEHTVDEVNDYLDANPDAAQTVLGLESEAETPRKGIIHGRHGTPEPAEPADDEPAEPAEGGVYDEQVDRTDAFLIPSFNTVPQAQQDEDAAARNAELEAAGVNHEQGFIGSDGASNLLG